jgi:hypothetical protein
MSYTPPSNHCPKPHLYHASPQDPIEGDMSYFGSWQGHVPDVLALVPWADMIRHSSAAGEVVRH